MVVKPIVTHPYFNVIRAAYLDFHVKRLYLKISAINAPDSVWLVKLALFNSIYEAD